MRRWALISVWDKSGVAELARVLSESGLGILSTAKSADFLRQEGIEVMEISAWTRAPEILRGRVKTIHPKVAAGILSMREDEVQELIDVVVCNLYPFSAGVKQGLKLPEMVELIDIGGVTLLRAAAKNWRFVTPVPAPEYYPLVIAQLREYGQVSERLRLELAIKSFEVTSKYDEAIREYLRQLLTGGDKF